MTQHEDGHPEEPRDERTHPSTNHPLHGERRPLVGPLLAVAGLFGVILVVFLVITYLRANT